MNQGGELDFSGPGDSLEALARDAIPIRTMAAGDLAALIRIDRAVGGRDRTPYYQRKLAESLDESGLTVSLIAEVDGRAVGFVMANVDFGEYGLTQPEAAIHTIGVHPDWSHRKIGAALLSQLLVNLTALKVERVTTELDWSSGQLTGLLNFLRKCGFRPAPRIPLRRLIS